VISFGFNRRVFQQNRPQSGLGVQATKCPLIAKQTSLKVASTSAFDPKLTPSQTNRIPFPNWS
jgi:hypothetical protein